MSSASLPVFLGAFLAAVSLLAHGADNAEDIDVRVKAEQGSVEIDVRFVVAATPKQVWEVLTDYENASRFISNLQESKVLSKSDRQIVVSQKGTLELGPFSVDIESVREIRLTPFTKTVSSAIGGTMKRADSVTQLVGVAEGTRIEHRSVSQPGAWIPPLVGPYLIERDARARFQELRSEILRRKARAP